MRKNRVYNRRLRYCRAPRRTNALRLSRPIRPSEVHRWISESSYQPSMHESVHVVFYHHDRINRFVDWGPRASGVKSTGGRTRWWSDVRCTLFRKMHALRHFQHPIETPSTSLPRDLDCRIYVPRTQRDIAGSCLTSSCP